MFIYLEELRNQTWPDVAAGLKIQVYDYAVFCHGFNGIPARFKYTQIDVATV